MASIETLGAEYRYESEVLLRRIKELEGALVVETNETERCMIRERLMMLKAMQRDARDIAGICERYYDRKAQRSINEKFSVSQPRRLRADGRRGVDPDLAAFFRELSMAQSNEAETSELKRNLNMAIREELTPQQVEYMRLYYVENLNRREIGEMVGVNKSTVSRTMKRGNERLRKCLRYGAAKLLVSDDKG